MIGYGLAGSVFHAPLIASIDDFVLDTVVTSNPQRQARVAADYPGARTVGAVEELWDRAGDLDLIVVASPNRTHVAFTEAALRAGLPVVVDKPICGTVAEAVSLADLADEQRLMLGVFQNRRWDGDFLTLRQLIAAGELGEIWRFESRFERWQPEIGKGWRDSADPVEVGGQLYDLGAHLVDQAVVLFGPPTAVYAEVVPRRPGAAVDDDSFVALEHGNGVRSHLWMSAVASQKGPRFRVLGSKAGFVKYGLDPQEDALKAGARPGPGWGAEPEQAFGLIGWDGAPGGDGLRTVPTLPGNYPAYYQEVAKALLSSGPPPVSARDVLTPLAVLGAAVVSAREGRVVRFGEGQ
jgi:predicted dehydrogenase